MSMVRVRFTRPGAGGLACFVALLLHAPGAQAHGTESEVRILGQSVDGYDVTVRTAPKQPRTGPLHIEVQLIAPDSLEYIDEATVTATARLRGGARQAGPVDSQYRTPWHEMHLNLDEGGTWDIRLAIDGPLGPTTTTFGVEIRPD